MTMALSGQAATQTPGLDPDDCVGAWIVGLVPPVHLPCNCEGLQSLSTACKGLFHHKAQKRTDALGAQEIPGLQDTVERLAYLGFV